MDKKQTEPEQPKALRYGHSQIPETMRDVILDKKTNTILTETDILTEILNKLETIERSIG